MKKFVCAIVLISMICMASFGAGQRGGSSSSSVPENAILIGGVNDLSGSRSILGNAINRGVEIAVKEINAAGGILGRQVTYKVYDNRNDVQETINAYTRLVDLDKAPVVITTDASSIFMGLMEISNQKKVALVGMPSDPRATRDMTTGIPYPYLFLVSQPNAVGQAEIVANYLQNNTNLSKAAIFYDQSNAYAVANIEAFQRVWRELGKEVVIVLTCNATDQDFRTQLSRIRTSGADFIYSPNDTPKQVLMANQATQLGLDLPYAGGMDMANPFLDLVSEPKQINAYFPAIAWMTDPKLNSLNRAYTEAYKEDATVKVVNGYDAMYIVKAAIEAAGSDNPEAIRNALQNNIRNLKTLVSDNYSMDPSTHAPLGLGMIICKITNGVLSNEGYFEPKR